MLKYNQVIKMTIQHLICFIAAARAKSFSVAAQGLFMSQPTFGRQIASMEQELGYPLFIRTTKGNVLTPGGQILAERLPEIIDAYETALEDAGAAQREERGKLLIGMLDGQFLDSHTNQLLESFRKTHPNIRVEIKRFSFRSMLTALQDRDLDIGITLLFDVEGKPMFAYRRIYTLPNELVFSANHPLAGVPGLKLSDFSNDTFIDLDLEESDQVSQLLRQTCLNAGFEPNIMRVPDLSAQIQYVEQGVGIAAFNKYHMACNHPALTHIPLPDFPPVDFCAAWMADAVNPAVSMFAELLDSLKS